MTLYQKGDREAANSLIKCMSPALHRFFSAFPGDRVYADDLVQETWLQIHAARHTYRPGDPVLPWVFAIARHVKVNAYRKRRFERHEEPHAVVPEPPAPLHSAKDLPDMETLLNALPASQREVVALLKVSGLSLEEVARATSSSVGAVKQKAHRAYERLRSVLAPLRGPVRSEKGFE